MSPNGASAGLHLSYRGLSAGRASVWRSVDGTGCSSLPFASRSILLLVRSGISSRFPWLLGRSRSPPPPPPCRPPRGARPSALPLPATPPDCCFAALLQSAPSSWSEHVPMAPPPPPDPELSFSSPYSITSWLRRSSCRSGEGELRVLRAEARCHFSQNRCHTLQHTNCVKCHPGTSVGAAGGDWAHSAGGTRAAKRENLQEIFLSPPTQHAPVEIRKSALLLFSGR